MSAQSWNLIVAYSNIGNINVGTGGTSGNTSTGAENASHTSRDIYRPRQYEPCQRYDFAIDLW